MNSDGTRSAARRGLMLLPLAFLALGLLLGSRIDRFTDDVWRLRLVARCEVHYHVPPISAVALACPGVG